MADETIPWYDNYYAAYEEAEQKSKPLFLFFRDEQQPLVADSYERTVLTDAILAQPLSKFVCAVIPLNATIPETGRLLLDHKAFVHQRHRQGIAVLDLTDSKSDSKRTVVSAHPFTKGRHLTAASTKIVLGLPQGTITQRSLIYAARIHPNKPAGAQGQATVKLLGFTQGHSNTMAGYHSMYHSNYPGMEIVASIGPGATIVETAKSFINMWAGSPAHWGILSGGHRRFGLDMKRSNSGHWYATGVFSN